MNASLEIQNGVKVLGQTPLDKKYYNNNNTPYASVEQVMTQLPISLRSRGLTVNIAGIEYWWPTSDITIDPVMKSPTAESVGALINTLTAKSTPTDSDLWTLRDEVTGLWRKINTTQLLAFLETNFDLKYEPINSVVVNYYVTNLTELIAAWTDAQTKTIPAKIYANGIMNLTANVTLGGTREIPIEGIPSVRFNLNRYELDIYRPHLTSAVFFEPNAAGYIKARNGYATLNRVFFGQDGYTLNSLVVPNIPHVLTVGAYTNNTGGVNINGIAHQTSLSHINENPDAIIQPIWIKDTSGQSGQRLFVDIKGVSIGRSFDRFAKVLITAENPNLIVAVGGDTTWFYDDTQPQPGSGINELSTLKPITSVHELRLNDFEEITTVADDDGVLVQQGNRVVLAPKTSVGTTNYSDLSNKPSINSIALEGNKTPAQLGLATAAQGAKADAALQSLPAGTVIDPDYNQFTGEEKTKLSGIQNNANNYAHPIGDGNQHVPPTGTTSAGKVLTAGATAGAITWETPASVIPADNSISNVKLTQVPTQTIKGRTTAETGNVEDLTVAEVIAMLGMPISFYEDVTLLREEWNPTNLQQTINVANVTEDSKIFLYPFTDRNNYLEYAACQVSAISKTNGTVTFETSLIPDINLHLTIETRK